MRTFFFVRWFRFHGKVTEKYNMSTLFLLFHRVGFKPRRRSIT